MKGLILLIVLAGSILLFWPRPSTREVDVLVPVVPENIAPGYTILDTPLKPLEVRLLGSPTDLALVNNSKLFYRLDLSDLGFGVHSIPIRPGDISLAKGVSIIHFHPKTLEITIDREIEKAIPIKLEVIGQVARGFRQTDAVVRPQIIRIKGPETVLEGINEIRTKPVDITGLTDSFKKEIALAVDHQLDITLPDTSIVVEIAIESKIGTKIFDNLPITAVNTPYRYRITPPNVHLTIKGAVTVLDTIDAERDIRVYLDLKDLEPGIYVRRALINLPVKTTLAGVEPQLFTVNLERP